MRKDVNFLRISLRFEQMKGRIWNIIYSWIISGWVGGERDNKEIHRNISWKIVKIRSPFWNSKMILHQFDQTIRKIENFLRIGVRKNESCPFPWRWRIFAIFQSIFSKLGGNGLGPKLKIRYLALMGWRQRKFQFFRIKS